jgi:DtxR family Mn-dependent transcriptional regulator
LSKTITSSLEDYLEAIFDIYSRQEVVRVTDISVQLGVEKSSVNTAVGKLKEMGLVDHKPYRDVRLTDAGLLEARAVKAKHDLLVRFLHEMLGLDAEKANLDACQIEHVISADTFKRLSSLMAFMDSCQVVCMSDWKEKFEAFIQEEE